MEKFTDLENKIIDLVSKEVYESQKKVTVSSIVLTLKNLSNKLKSTTLWQDENRFKEGYSMNFFEKIFSKNQCKVKIFCNSNDASDILLIAQMGKKIEDMGCKCQIVIEPTEATIKPADVSDLEQQS